MPWTVTPDALNTSAQKFRKQLIMAMLIGIQNTVKHMTVRPGITYRETVGELTGDIELAPYTGAAPSGLSDAAIAGRTLETFLGQVYELFHMRDLQSTIYGMDLSAQKRSDKFDINKAMLFYIANQASGKLNRSVFNAVRDDSGTTTADLFNGLDTIALAEISDSTITEVLGNLFAISGAIDDSNAIDTLKAFYRASSDELQGIHTKMLLPRDVYNAYNDDYQTTVGAAPYNKEFQKTYLEGSSDMCELVPMIGKKDSTILQLTTKQNLLIGVDQMSDIEKVRVKEDNNVNWTQFVLNMFFGTQYESLDPTRLMVAQITIS